jgi:probable F420-dependent oxidoreductase
MRFGVLLGLYEPQLGLQAMIRRAQTAEQLGYDSLWAGDHIVIPNVVDQTPHFRDVGDTYPEGSEYLEPITLLSFLAGQTRSIKLGVGVLVVPYRNPILAAKMLATVDVVSGGRLLAGVGAGWMREEFEVLRTPPYSERGRVTDDYIAVYKALWTQDNPSFDGKHYSVSDLAFWPKPLQKPHPPIWVGGNGIAAIRRTAALGDGWMPVYLSPADMATKIKELRALYERAGRDPATVTTAIGTRFRFTESAAGSDRHMITGTPRQMLDDVRRYQEAGVDEIHLLHRAGTIEEVPTEELVTNWRRFAEEVRSRL